MIINLDNQGLGKSDRNKEEGGKPTRIGEAIKMCWQESALAK